MIRCLVTDRRRLRPAASWADERAALLDQARTAVGDGVDFIQIRERDLEAAALASLVDDLVALARGSRTRVIVNDRLDVALACGAGGVHLRADSIGAADVRRLAPPPFVVSRSVHAPDEARRAGPVDFLIAGTVFASQSKAAEAPLIGLDGLSAIVAAVDVPVLAIGGVTPSRIAEIVRAGAAGFAAIGLFVDSRGAAS